MTNLIANQDGSIRTEDGILIGLIERNELPDGRGFLHYAGEMIVVANDEEAFDVIEKIEGAE